MADKTRFRRWKDKKRAAGCCVNCGKPRELYADMCNACTDRKRERNYQNKLRRKAANKQSTLGNPEWVKGRNEYMRVYRRKLKLEAIAAYGGACACCGETYAEFLSIDHLNKDGAAERRDNPNFHVTEKFYRHLRNLGWPKDRYRLLCLNCNSSIGYYGYCPHDGTAVRLFIGEAQAPLRRMPRNEFGLRRKVG